MSQVEKGLGMMVLGVEQDIRGKVEACASFGVLIQYVIKIEAEFKVFTIFA
jgi:hypothetical protein